MSAADQGCSLLAGEPECRCAADVAVLNDHELAERATEKFLWQQRAHATGRRAAEKRGLDAMLDAVRYRGPSAPVSELIRLGAMPRILGEDPSEVEEAGALLSELAEIAELDGDTRMLGEVAAMRAHRTIMFGQGENALADAASAFAILTDAPIPPAAEEARKLSRVARVPLHSESAVALGAADAAMYRAKRSGGNRVVGELQLVAAHRRQVPPRRSLVMVSNESTDAFRRITPA